MRALVACFSTLCAVGWSIAGYAQAIHKCTAPEGTAYQSAPCGTGSSDVVIASRTGERAGPPPAVTTPRRAPETRGGRVFWRTSIALGMSDDEVLNLANWGRPSAITRSKFNRIWHEEWLYRWSMGGTSRLQFANGRLTAVETGASDTGPETQVSLTLR